MTNKKDILTSLQFGLDINDDAFKEYKRRFAQSGGLAFVKKYGKEKMTELSKLAVEAKKRKKNAQKTP